MTGGIVSSTAHCWLNIYPIPIVKIDKVSCVWITDRPTRWFNGESRGKPRWALYLQHPCSARLLYH